MPARFRVRPHLLVHLIVLGVLGLLWPRAPLQRLDVFDQPFYLGIAFDIVHSGRFTDGYFFARDYPDGARPAGMRFGPLYPATLAALATVDPVLRRDMDCEVRGRGHDEACGRAAPSARWLQFALLVFAFAAVWRIGRQLAPARPAVAAAGLALALATAPTLLASANYLMTETIAFALTTWFTEALVAAVVTDAARRAAVAAAIAGALLGLASLCRPGFAALVPAVAAGLVLVRAARWPRALSFGGAALLVLAPWVVRNDVVLGRAGLSFGYAAHTLAQRVAFDGMNGREYALSYLCWLPDGNGLGRALVGPHACDRFGWNDRPDTFYAIGMDRLVPATRRAAGSDANWLPYLLRHDVLAHPLRHALTTIPLALRGLFVAHWWGFVLGIAAAWWTARAWRARDRGVLALALPAWAMLALNAAVAVDQPRYNFMLIPLLALAGGFALVNRTTAGKRSS